MANVQTSYWPLNGHGEVQSSLENQTSGLRSAKVKANGKYGTCCDEHPTQ